MILYTCPAKDSGPALMHPCAKAARALDDAGLEYEIETVPGFKAMPWTRGGKREQIRALTGQEDVPVLVQDDGQVVTGNRAIVQWAAAQANAVP